uniref:Uncharacterized protein n=1 Tax=Cuerna arida TaxID=1464854 RepID=A0A1B6GZI0_9HEMI
MSHIDRSEIDRILCSDGDDSDNSQLFGSDDSDVDPDCDPDDVDPRNLEEETAFSDNEMTVNSDSNISMNEEQIGPNDLDQIMDIDSDNNVLVYSYPKENVSFLIKL